MPKQTKQQPFRQQNPSAMFCASLQGIGASPSSMASPAAGPLAIGSADSAAATAPAAVSSAASVDPWWLAAADASLQNGNDALMPLLHTPITP
jgi:hypothetical protein